MGEQPPSRKLSRRTFDWLEAESRLWVDAGTLDEAARARILSRYDTESLPHRGTMALTLIAVLMCAIGVLLVIGYNWERIPATVKVAMIMASVAAAFGGAAAAYARKRHTLGEVLSFSGTLLFGNAIWLIAQVLHIQGHFPDAFLWFAVGALVAAFLVESVVIGVGGTVLCGVWIISEASFYPHVIYPFLVLWPCAVWVAYRLDSTVMVRTLGLVAALWVAIATVNDSHLDVWPAAVILAACGMYAVGRWHAAGNEIGSAWRMSALGALLLAIMPLMASGFYSDMAKGANRPTMLIAAIGGAVALSAVRRPVRVPADWAVLATAIATALWAVAAGSGLIAGSWQLRTISPIVFSGVSLVLCVTLIRSAFGSNRTSDLVFGVLFGLAFVSVRWASVIENLLWSGLLLLTTGGGLLFIARQWLRRDRSLAMGRA